jgi:hypothetical protein
MWVGVGLAASFTAFRTVVQYQNNGKFFKNDYLIILALVFHIVTSSIQQVANPIMFNIQNLNAGLMTMPPDFLTREDIYLRLQFVLNITSWTTLWLVKFSLLFFFWRLFDSVQTLTRYFWWFMCCIAGATYITSIALQLATCNHVSDYFTIGNFHGTNGDRV